MLNKILKGLIKGFLIIFGMYIIADIVANEAIKSHHRLAHDDDDIDDFYDMMEESVDIGGIS